MDQIVIPPDSEVGEKLSQAAKECRIILLAGVPGVGKSLFLQQLALYADQAGRTVHLLQWDMVREAFEAPVYLEKFPEIDGITHPGIRKAVGIWCRNTIHSWDTNFADPENILLIEVPIIGGRLAELIYQEEDATEVLLASNKTQAFTIVPSPDIRQAIVGIRSDTIANPRHEKETRDAPDNVVMETWMEIRKIYNEWQGGKQDADLQGYDAEIYSSVFTSLLKHRRHEILSITELYPTRGSVYDLDLEVHDLAAAPEDVASAYADMERRYPGSAVEKAIDNWYQF